MSTVRSHVLEILDEEAVIESVNKFVVFFAPDNMSIGLYGRVSICLCSRVYEGDLTNNHFLYHFKASLFSGHCFIFK